MKNTGLQLYSGGKHIGLEIKTKVLTQIVKGQINTECSNVIGRANES